MRLVASSYFTKKFLFSDFSLSNITYFFVRLQDQLRLWIKGITLKRSSLELMVYSQYVYLILLFLQNHTLSKFSSLMDIVAVDYPQRGKNRFELHYVLWSSYFSVPLSIKCFGGNNLSLSSVSSLFNSANWLEREIWDMYGIKFLFHPNLRRILTDYGFRGYPLRKDFPLIGFIELRYDDLYKSVFVEPVELSQNIRYFRFQNPWSNWR